MLISEGNKRQFLEEGYFLLPEAIEQTMLDSICDVCDYCIEEFNTSERVNESDDASSHEGELYTRVTGDGKQFETSVLNIKNSRYFLEQRHQEHPDLAKFIFSELMAEICKATIGQNAYFHFEEFVVKFPRGGASFSWHQDGAYVPKHGLPYVSAWCSLDAVSPENGTIYVLPYSRAGTRDLVDHSRDEKEMERTGYHGEDPESPWFFQQVVWLCLRVMSCIGVVIIYRMLSAVHFLCNLVPNQFYLRTVLPPGIQLTHFFVMEKLFHRVIQRHTILDYGI